MRNETPAPKRNRLSAWWGLCGLLVITLLPAALAVWLGPAATIAEYVVTLVTAGCAGILIGALACHRWRTACGLAFLLALVAVPHALFLLVFHAPIDANALALIPESNPSDAWEMISTVPAGIWLLLLLPVVLLAAAWRRPDVRPTLLREKLLPVSAALLLGLTYFTVYVPPAQVRHDFEFPRAPTDRAVAWRSGYPIGFAWVVSDLVRERRALASAAEYMGQYRFGVKASSPPRQRRVYLLVIGEASRADRWQLNGYARPTTPRLSARSDLVVFPRMYSPWAFSRLAVPLILTRKSSESQAALFDQASVITAFKEAGFRTAWVSLKPAVGYHASPVTIHAQEAHQTVYLNLVKNGRLKPDEAAITAVNRLIDSSTGDLFVVVHTMGSHFDYAERYPANRHMPFLPDRPVTRRTRLFSRSDREYLSNAYDNSVVATDAFLASLIETLDARRAVESWAYYVSDHGEALFDDCRGQSGHAHLSYATQSTAALLWASRAYRARQGALLERIQRNRNGPLSITSTFETLTDLAEIEVPGARAGYSLASATPRTPPEALAAERDRDQACRNVAGNGQLVASHDW